MKHKYTAEFLRSYRISKGLTQKQLGMKLKFHPQAIWNAEKGKCSIKPERLKVLDRHTRAQFCKAMVKDYIAEIREKMGLKK